MVYYNMKVAEAAGVDPTKWTSLDDMCADMEKVKDAGYTFIAMGGNTFQAGYLFHALLAAVAGPDIYNRFYARGRHPDETVFDEPGLRDAIEVFRKITGQADAGWVNRAVERHHQHGDLRQGADADPRRLDEGPVEGQRQGARRGFRLHQHPRHQGAVGDGRRLRHPRRRRRRTTLKARATIRRASWSTPKINAEFASSRDRARCGSTCRPTSSTPATSWCWRSLKKPGFSVQNPFYIADADWHQLGLEHDVHLPGRPGHDHRRRDRDAEGGVRGDLLRTRALGGRRRGASVSVPRKGMRMRGFTQIAHVALKVRDLDRSLGFYAGKLGFEEMMRLSKPDGSPGVWLVYLRITDDQYLELFPDGAGERAPGREATGVNHFCLGVNDLDAVLAQLDAAGIPLFMPKKMGADGNLQAWIEDPDGNRIELMQMMPGCMQREAIAAMRERAVPA